MRLALVLALLALPSLARADDGVARKYLAIDGGAYAGAGFEGLNVTGFRVAATAGLRVALARIRQRL